MQFGIFLGAASSLNTTEHSVLAVCSVDGGFSVQVHLGCLCTSFLTVSFTVKYLQEALDLLESFHRRDTHREDSELVSVECSSSS